MPICIFISTSSPTVRRRGEGEEEKSPGAMPVSSSQRGEGFHPLLNRTKCKIKATEITTFEYLIISKVCILRIPSPSFAFAVGRLAVSGPDLTCLVFPPISYTHPPPPPPKKMMTMPPEKRRRRGDFSFESCEHIFPPSHTLPPLC